MPSDLEFYSPINILVCFADSLCFSRVVSHLFSSFSFSWSQLVRPIAKAGHPCEKLDRDVGGTRRFHCGGSRRDPGEPLRGAPLGPRRPQCYALLSRAAHLVGLPPRVPDGGAAPPAQRSPLFEYSSGGVACGANGACGACFACGACGACGACFACRSRV